MNETIAMIEASMRADADALRMIGQNIANAEVPAYRRMIPLNAAGFDQLVDAADSATANAARTLGSSVAMDKSPGTFKTTGEPLDVAIEGAGFFALQSPTGVLLTRRGDFHVSADGLLTAASGNAVLGTNGPIQVGSTTPVIESDGSVRLGADIVEQLQIMQFENEAQLEYLGDGVYANPHSIAAASETYPTVRQGALETSNVAPVGEMVQLMETMRHFEAAQRVARGYDQMIEKAISELGKVG
jgi:flagellar basal-body rod protein FlgF